MMHGTSAFVGTRSQFRKKEVYDPVKRAFVTVPLQGDASGVAMAKYYFAQVGTTVVVQDSRPFRTCLQCRRSRANDLRSRN